MKLTVAFDARCSSARCSPLHQGRPPCWCRRSPFGTTNLKSFRGRNP